MAIARRAIGPLASVVGPALSALVLLAQPARGEPCAPRAELAGDAEAVANVTVELERLGVEATTEHGRAASPRCPVIVAVVEIDRGGGIAVAVRDSARRSEGRVVSDAVLAAVWIDSWLRDDFGAHEPLDTPMGPSATQATATLSEPGSVFERFAATAAFTQTWTDDSTQWSGVNVAGCVNVAGFCLGARAAFGAQDITVNATGAARRDLSVLATASYSFALGRVSIAPELGLGAGQLTTSRIDGCKTAMCDPSDPMCVMAPPPMCTEPGTVYVGDGLEATTYTPRVAAALRIAIPLFEHIWLDGSASFTLAPFGHHDPYQSPNMMFADDSLALPGDPLYGAQLGIGLRVGAP